jgi:hypothetical protein
VGVHQGGVLISPEGRFAGKAFERDTAERVDVGSLIEGPTLELLGAAYRMVPANTPVP